MIKTNQIYIPIPKKRNTKCKITINGTDMTTRIMESTFVIPCTNGVGTFSVKISNAKGQYSGNFAAGDVVIFYADNNDASTVQFYGRIDYVKDDISSEGQYLNIDGRHRSFLLNEYLVCHSATDIETSQILKDIIDKLPAEYGFTYTNVNTSAVNMNVEWSYKSFWDCITELCNKAGFDCYVDNDMDFHYFEENSISNEEDAVVEGDNFIKCSDYGTNDYYEKTRVTAMGQDDAGLPIIYTSVIAGEGDTIKEVFVKDTSANTYDSVKDIADAKLAEVTNKNPQAVITSFGLETAKPGDNIWIIIPRQKIAGQYKLVQITHKFGMKIGGWRTECLTEEQESGVSTVLENLTKTNQQITESDNVNKMTYSYNFDFNTDNGTHSNTIITGGVLKTNGVYSGDWISPVRTLTTTPTQFEVRVVGESMIYNKYYVSTDNGVTWQEATSLNTKIAFSPIGNNIKIKVEVVTENSKVDSISLLYQ
jgi:hypothetical protein